MKEKSDIDRRILRTRHMLSDALFVLIIERGYEALTVQDITERANIGRATFYLHYHDKEQLLEDSLLHLIEEFIQYVELKPGSPDTYQTLSVRVFQHIAEQHQIYRALLRAEGPPSVSVQLRKCLALLIQKRVLQPLSERSNTKIAPELLAAHSAGSLLALVIWWLDADLAPTAEKMGELFYRLIAPGVEGVLGLKNGKAVEIPNGH
ncbi:MAG TPA: TetR/AcrR family transcriptional regulator [Ktedonobacteraceae bacterium]|nr:TetR/AcrR family transcriptional regulator [Ktedonobacteraceae bacterium]